MSIICWSQGVRPPDRANKSSALRTDTNNYYSKRELIDNKWFTIQLGVNALHSCIEPRRELKQRSSRTKCFDCTLEANPTSGVSQNSTRQCTPMTKFVMDGKMAASFFVLIITFTSIQFHIHRNSNNNTAATIFVK